MSTLPAARPDAPAAPTERRGAVVPGWVAPVAVAGAAALGAAALALRSPHVPGSWGACPFLALTGLWCPACGGLRAVHELTQGDLAGAFAMNPAVVLALPLVATVWSWWFLGALGRRPTGGPVAAVGHLVSVRAAWVVLALAVVFTVLRNLPGLEVLAPV